MTREPNLITSMICS